MWIRGRDLLAGRARNDPAQYDELADEWWRPYGRFAGLQAIAADRATLVPAPPYDGAPLLDVACGAGLLAPHLRGRLRGWRHVGVDVSQTSLRQARDHGVTPVRADALRLPFADGSVPCVVAGELLEHLPDTRAACAELARVLAPGGTLVLDTIADSLFARVAVVRIAEHLPGGPPPGVHDPALLVDPGRLLQLLADQDVHPVYVGGLRPSVLGYAAWLARRRRRLEMVRTRSTAGVYQIMARKTA
jgi:2-polyprenyl-6-hydroxyphenyl methylase/3-demethylubiquinone-9 3-methyltransferase